MPSARPPKRKKGTSAPRDAAISIRRALEIFPRVSRKYPRNAAAASLEPPPRPRPAGIFLFRSISTPFRISSSRRKASTALYTRFLRAGSRERDWFPLMFRQMPAVLESRRRRLTWANAGIRISRMRLLRLGFLNRRFLGYAMLGLAEFLFDFSDFFIFHISGQSVTPFGERFLPFGRG